MGKAYTIIEKSIAAEQAVTKDAESYFKEYGRLKMRDAMRLALLELDRAGVFHVAETKRVAVIEVLTHAANLATE